MCKWRLWSPLWFRVKIFKSFKIQFYWSDINVFIKKLVLNDSCKVLKGLKEFLNFLKFPCGPPFACASDACGPPFGFRSKFLNCSKCNFILQYKYFRQKISFKWFLLSFEGFEGVFEFFEISLWSPLCMWKWRLWSPLWFWVKIFKSLKIQFYWSDINVFIKKLVLNYSCKVLKGLKEFLNF